MVKKMNENETTKFVKEVAGNLIRSTAKSVQQNLESAIDGVMGWLRCWGEKQKILQEKYLEDFKKRVSTKISDVPQEDLVEPSVSIVGPIVEACKYYYEDTHYQEMFSELLASACDQRHVHAIHPSFVEILKQLAPLDAKLLSMFKHHGTYALCDVQEIHRDGLITPYTQSLFDFKDKQGEFTLEEHLGLTSSLDNLARLGVVMKNRDIIELSYNYDAFQNHFMYKSYLSTKNIDSTFKILKARIELTDFGRRLGCVVFLK